MQQGETDKNNTKWHTLSVEQTFESLSSGEAGISDSSAQQRLIEHGPNCLPQAKRPNLILRFFAHFHNILIYVLLVSACITALLGHYIDTGVILAVVIVNAVIGYIQEGKAEQAMDAIRHILAPQANVVRASERKTVSGQDLVLGDVVLLEAGDKVPADLRLFSTHSLSMQEAILTGESLPVEKNTLTSADEAAIGDRKGMAYSGTLVSQGQARGVVVATGADTEIGRISGLLSKVETLRTPLVAQMGVFAKWLTFMILLLASLLLAFGYFVFNYPFTDMFMAVVGLSVAAIPEGLPTVLTITLAIGVKAMAKRNAIVRRLPAIETIGSVSVICTDKTGTLTRNEMMVASLITHNNIYTVSGNGYEPKGSVQLAGKTIPPEKYKEHHEIGLACAICNNAELKQQGDTWRAEGDPMEAALLSFSEKLALSFKDEQKKWTRTDVIPFDARHRYMATLNHYPDYDQDQDQHQNAYVFVKGAPEKILAMCENQRGSNGTSEALNTDYWHHAIEETAAHGQRLLALAILPVSAQKTALKHEDISGKLTLIGMLGLIDPPRAEAISAIVECHQAGIAVKMITGDHTKTAAAIGQQIGLRNTNKVLTGADIDAMDDAAIKQAVLDCDVFARTSPEHKLKLVMALQSHGMTVAMTGDGVNDAPSLKRADAGIAMGLKGSEAAKEAADLVLADDNFSSIVAGVREGRTVYDNLKKVISWTLPTNAGEAITIIVALLLGMTLPITAVQILWVNLITAITLGIALAFEPTEESTMQRPPRNRNDPLLNGTLVWHVVFVSFLFLCGIFGIFQYAIERGYSVDLARTMAMNTLVVMEIFQLFFIRNIYSTSLTWKAVRGTKMVWLVVIVVGVAQLAISYLPSLQKIFATQAIGFFDGLLILTIGVALFAIIETEKQIRLAIIRMRAAE